MRPHRRSPVCASLVALPDRVRDVVGQKIDALHRHLARFVHRDVRAPFRLQSKLLLSIART